MQCTLAQGSWVVSHSPDEEQEMQSKVTHLREGWYLQDELLGCCLDVSRAGWLCWQSASFQERMVQFLL